MIELEILVKLNNIKVNEAKEVLLNFEQSKTSHIIDTYYFDPLRDKLSPDENLRLNNSFRVRTINDNLSKLTYKLDKFDEEGKWLYSDEIELKVSSSEDMKHILNHLGLEVLIIIDNSKTYFKHPEYEIVLEEVKNLGLFLEVELLNDISEDEAILKKKEIYKFIDSLGFKDFEEMDAGKPELILKKTTS
ncbi:MAG: class IV adenylate cyclase [Candidatus Dojkabacteria bacterium]|nr:class IV adenylate cyclase [Candidatus Dojkabacteria bacterium]MDQ7021796.1 class IV adenylate cyclase [Candidatus Dojkabacteria bacterium]